MNSKRNGFNILVIVLFCAMLVFFFYVGVVAPKDETAAERENRELKKMPEIATGTLLSGQFSKEFEDYLADNVGYRSLFMDISAKIEASKGFKTNAGKVVTANKDLGTGNQGDNKLLILSDRVMEIYRKNDVAAGKYIDMLNRYAEKLPSSVQMFSMLIPTQVEFYPGADADSQKETIDSIYAGLHERISCVDAYSRLQEKKDEYIYFRTDHHWTQRGAFCAYKAFSKTALGKTPDISEYQLNQRAGFLGYLYNQANDLSLQKYADTIEWFKKGENLTVEARAFENGGFVDYKSKLYAVPPMSEQVKYSLFMGGDHQFAKISTSVKNGKTLLVIKDSYANALLPLLAADYETILVIDPRSYYGTVTELVEEYKVEHCLIMNYVFTTTFEDFIDKMIQIL